MKLGLIVPTRADERAIFRPQWKALIEAQTLHPDKVYCIDYPPKDDKPDLIDRLRLGAQQAADDGMDRVFVWEDDDYYAPTYLEHQMSLWPTNVGVFGIYQTIYYHVKYCRWREFYHPTHASLCMTGFVPGLLAQIIMAPRIRAFSVDHAIWKWAHKYSSCLLVPNTLKCIGIKHGIGLCGTIEHKSDPQFYPIIDFDYHWLNQFVVPEFQAFYKSFKEERSPVVVAGTEQHVL